MRNIAILTAVTVLLAPQAQAFGYKCPNEESAPHPNGGGWVSSSSHVDSTVYIGRSSSVCDGSQVRGQAVVRNSSMVSNGSYVSDHVIVDHSDVGYGAKISGHAILKDTRVHSSTVSDHPVLRWSEVLDSSVSGHARLRNAKISNVRVYGSARIHDIVYTIKGGQIYGSARVKGNVIVRDNAQIYGNAIVLNGAQFSGSAKVNCGRWNGHGVIVTDDQTNKCGKVTDQGTHWLWRPSGQAGPSHAESN